MAPFSDAIIVVPGIMGSQLRTKGPQGGELLWGMSGKLLSRTWIQGEFRRLAVTEDDLSGRSSVEATGLLRRAAWMPFLGGLEPYTDLMAALRAYVPDPSAVVEFPYDWRLPVDTNGKLLAERCHRVIEAWRSKVAQQRLADPDEVRVVIVAHSMGGLVAGHALREPGVDSVVRRVLTLGTPHFGAVTAAQMLAAGGSGHVRVPAVGEIKLPRRLRSAMHELALTCPAVYDLLPRYRCVVEKAAPRQLASDRGFGQYLRYLDVSDIAAIGAHPDLADDAAQRHEDREVASPVPVMALAGTGQPTLQSLELEAGSCRFFTSLGDYDESNNPAGDGTVYRRAAAAPSVPASPIPQRHGALARSRESLAFVLDALRGGHLPPPLGTRPLALDVPDAASAGDPIVVRVSEVGNPGRADSVGLSVRSVDVDTGVATAWTDRRVVDGVLEYRSPVLAPGIYRVLLAGGGFSPVSDIVLVDEPINGGL